MIIKLTKSYKKQLKKLNKYPKEYDNLERILEHTRRCCSFDELSNNPVSRMYGFERLKHEFNNFYSFNLSKHGGVISLMFCYVNSTIYFVFISYDHYKDFSLEKVIMYDE